MAISYYEKAKMFKAAGYLSEMNGDIKRAINNYRKAKDYNLAIKLAKYSGDVETVTAIHKEAAWEKASIEDETEKIFFEEQKNK